MIDAYDELGEAANIIAVEEVPQDQVSSYGVVGVGERKGKSFAHHRHGGEAEAARTRRRT